MLTAEEAREETKKNWIKHVEWLIYQATEKHQYSTEGIIDMPQFVKDELIKNGYTLEYEHSTYLYISWKSLTEKE